LAVGQMPGSNMDTWCTPCSLHQQVMFLPYIPGGLPAAKGHGRQSKTSLTANIRLPAWLPCKDSMQCRRGSDKH
jgi:hypothetical protein